MKIKKFFSFRKPKVTGKPVQDIHTFCGQFIYGVPKEPWLMRLFLAHNYCFMISLKKFNKERKSVDIDVMNLSEVGFKNGPRFLLDYETGRTNLLNEADQSLILFKSKEDAILFMKRSLLDLIGKVPNIPYYEMPEGINDIAIKLKSENSKPIIIRRELIGKTILGIPTSFYPGVSNGFYAHDILDLTEPSAHQVIKKYGPSVVKRISVISHNEKSNRFTLSYEDNWEKITFEIDGKTGKPCDSSWLNKVKLKGRHFEFFVDAEHLFKYSEREHLIDLAEPYFKNRLVCHSITNKTLKDVIKTISFAI